MTKDFLQKKLSELIYELGECNFNAVTAEFWEKHINRDEPFNDAQIEAYELHVKELMQEEFKELSKKYIF